jgi:hypothetical protein
MNAAVPQLASPAVRSSVRQLLDEAGYREDRPVVFPPVDLVCC